MLAEGIPAGRSMIWRRGTGRSAWLSLIVVVGGLILLWFFRDFSTSYEPSKVDIGRALLPIGSPGSPLGTDAYGRDVLARLIAGIPVSIMAGIVPAIAGMGLGIAVGLASGYMGGWVDQVITALMDVLLALPFILLAILAVAVLGPSLQNSMIAVTLAILPRNARIIRADTLSLRERDYVIAARLGGASGFAVVVRHLLPNVLPTAFIVGSLEVGQMIAATAGLSFLGLGVQAPDVDWGTMISDGSGYLTTAPQLALIPSLLVAIVALVFVYVGDDLRHRQRNGG